MSRLYGISLKERARGLKCSFGCPAGLECFEVSSGNEVLRDVHEN